MDEPSEVSASGTAEFDSREQFTHNGRANSDPASTRDGTSHTAMTGEVQRLRGPTASPIDHRTSQDGWAVGSSSTHFSTCSDACLGINGDHFEEPGSDHGGGAHIGLADGSVKFLSQNMSIFILTALGTMANQDGPSEEL